MFDLKKFQRTAAESISSRFEFFTQHEFRPKRGKLDRPYFQALSAITGSGKTPILAHSIALMRLQMEEEPIVLWMSKARAVISQTFINFSIGGKYSEIIPDYNVVELIHLKSEDISDLRPLLITATTALFNQKDQDESLLRIYKENSDKFGQKSGWKKFIERPGINGRRPLVIVYDEGHNFSEQQAELLEELEPDAYILASATLKLPQNFRDRVVRHVTNWYQENPLTDVQKKELNLSDDDASEFIVTSVETKKVVDEGLIKREIEFEGTTAAMELCLDECLNKLELIQRAANTENVNIRPKAIYVCNTNITHDGIRDDKSLPFSQRSAPPVRIWNYLVGKGVPPSEIGVYLDLEVDSSALPDDFNLYSKGDRDFEKFSEANYSHIIFNQSLQEGWDDPECYVAYIDKSMGSNIRAEQIVGRVLRQPLAMHYHADILNTAHVIVRVDNQKVFTEVINKLQDKLKEEGGVVNVTAKFSKTPAGKSILEPRDGLDVKIADVGVNSHTAKTEIGKLIDDFHSYNKSDSSTKSRATLAKHTVRVGHHNQNIDTNRLKEKRRGRKNSVRLRWIISNDLKSKSPRAFSTAKFTDPKFDVLVQLDSPAANQAIKMNDEIIKTFKKYSTLSYEEFNCKSLPPIRVSDKATKFDRSLYEMYDDLNPLEMEAANALDDLDVIWHRNPSNGGYRIPLLFGDQDNFFPDFIVWTGNDIILLETKGNFLLNDAIDNKLFDIHDSTGRIALRTRFIAPGRRSDVNEELKPGGHTVYKFTTNHLLAFPFDTMTEAVKFAISIENT